MACCGKFLNLEVGDLGRVKRGPAKGSIGIITELHDKPKLRINPYASLSDGNKYTLTNVEVVKRSGSKV